MDKEIFYFGKTASGVFAQSLFGSAGCFEKTAGAPPFAEWETGEDLRRFIEKIGSKERKENVYVLLNALGGGEWFGSNINADYFPWEALSHDGKDYGYKTFLDGHAFQHHVNKDPERAFGQPVLSLLHPSMRRVELVVRLGREQAKANGAEGVLKRVEAGEWPDVSMGCRVPFDVCSICGHQSKTRDDYCVHMRPPAELRHLYGPNKILPDGSKIYVINTRPRFFDISFVFIGADKTAKVMAKLAERGSHVCFGDVCAIPALVSAPCGELADSPRIEPILHKIASPSCGDECSSCSPCQYEKLADAFGVKHASHKKFSEIVKDVPAGAFAMRTLPSMEKEEPDIAKEDLDHLSKHPLTRALGSAARLGIVLKPHEFQHLVLRRMGEDDLLNRLDREHKVFRQVSEFSDVGMDDPIDSIFESLKKYVKERTALGTPFQIRVLIAGKGGKKALPTRRPVEHSLLDKVSAAYNGYRRSFLKKFSHVVNAVESDPKLREEILGDGLSNMFNKMANTEIFTFDSMRYLLGAHLQDRSLLSNAVAGAAVSEFGDLIESRHLA